MLRVLELFCGIGGCAAALANRAEVVAAIDVSRPAVEVYRHNYAHPAHVRAIERLASPRFAEWRADLWWLSPPCQPFTLRGHRRDVDDRRARALLVLIDRIGEHRPRYVAMENVPGFRASRAHRRLRTALDAAGYHVVEGLLCPTELGAPNRRRRFYLVAAQHPLCLWPEPKKVLADAGRLDQPIDPEGAPNLVIPSELAAAYTGALHVVDLDDPEAISNCFTAAYGRSPVRSGSYLRCAAGLRRFSPAEILTQLGFPPSFTLPPSLSVRRGWRLAGNSVSVDAVRHVLRAIPALAS